MDKPSPTPIPRFVFWLVLWSLLLQIAMIGVFRQYRTRPIEDHFAFGWEMGRVARSIALGQGFSNPYGVNTGPTAWEPPLSPAARAPSGAPPGRHSQRPAPKASAATRPPGGTHPANAASAYPAKNVQKHVLSL